METKRVALFSATIYKFCEPYGRQAVEIVRKTLTPHGAEAIIQRALEPQ